uniref:SecE/Sec61-gamma subunits of protein translocation complex n=1 Tax=Musca domestica TaxID=7370 RepID=T1PBY8_MUSDO
MNNGFGYSNPSGSIKNFSCLRTITYWAGFFGLFQSLLFIALTITGILSYNCVINVNGTFNYASVVPTIFMALYFKSTCTPDAFPAYQSEFIKTKTILDPTDILIWDCVYLGVAVCWLIASGLILMYVTKDNRKNTLGVLLTWVIITLMICCMDFVLGVIFGVDYGRFRAEAADYNLSSAYAGEIQPQAAQVLAATIAAISMMLLTFKGFVLWIINVGFAVYLLVQSIFIMRDNDGTANLFMPRKDSDDILATRPPINAYQEEKTEVMATVFTNEAFVPDNNTPSEDFNINQDVISRAARLSKDVSFQERRFRNLENFQQYPPRSRPESTIPEKGEAQIVVGAFPAPDYTPPMQRAAQNRNNYYQ